MARLFCNPQQAPIELSKFHPFNSKVYSGSKGTSRKNGPNLQESLSYREIVEAPFVMVTLDGAAPLDAEQRQFLEQATLSLFTRIKSGVTG